MFHIFRSMQEIIRLVRLINTVSRQKGEGDPLFGYMLTNRSFLVPFFGLVLNVLIVLNFPVLAPIVDFLQAQNPDLMAEHVVAFVTAVTVLWGVFERSLTSAKVILTRGKAEKVLKEVVGDDALAEALKQAVLKKP